MRQKELRKRFRESQERVDEQRHLSEQTGREKESAPEESKKLEEELPDAKATEEAALQRA